MTEITMTTSTMSPGLTSLKNPLDIEFNKDIKSNKRDYVINIE